MTVDPQRISQTIHDLIHPWTPMNPGGDPVAAENFAGLVDAIAEISTVYTPNGNSVETLYGQLVQANTPVTAPGIPPAPVPSSPHPRPVVPLPPLVGVNRFATAASRINSFAD